MFVVRSRESDVTWRTRMIPIAPRRDAKESVYNSDVLLTLQFQERKSHAELPADFSWVSVSKQWSQHVAVHVYV